MLAPHSVTERERVRVVKGLDLRLASHAVVDGRDTGVGMVHPGALNISLLLWVARLIVDFADEIRDRLYLLLLIRARIATALLVVSLLEVSGCLLRIHRHRLSMERLLRRGEVSLVVVLRETVDHRTEASILPADRSVDQRKLSDVVLVYHAGDDSLLHAMDLRVLDL